MDRDDYLACFTDDATVRDPYGGRPLEGKEGLNKFIDGMERTWRVFHMEPRETFASGDRVATLWVAHATAKSGKTAEFSGINIFTLNEAGLIATLESYWDFEAMVAQIS